MGEQAQIPLTDYAEARLGQLEYISRSIMATVSLLSSFSTRTADEIDHIASLFEGDARVLRRRAQQLREKSHA